MSEQTASKKPSAYGTAKQVWDAIKRSYLDVSDSSQVYELMKKSFQSRQVGRPLAEYYNELNSIFLELDYRRLNDMTCPTDIEKQRRRTVEERVYIFLAGLDHNLDQVSGRVLATSPLPSLEEAYSQVRCEAQRQTTMSAEDQSEASAMAVNKPTPIVNTFNRFCTHCNSTKHTVDVCWKKHGYPEWATDHMTSNPSLLDSLMTSNVKSVQVANGTPMPISGAGNVSFSSTLPMSSVLLAPNLSNNLLSISKITKTLNCSVTFHSTYCVFQDNLTKKTIGIGEINSKEEEKLWLEEKRWWISSKGEEDSTDSVDSGNTKSKPKEVKERPDSLFQQHYTKRNKSVTAIPSPRSNIPLNDITMPSNDSSGTNSEVQISSPLTSENAILNSQSDQGRRYPIRDRKEPDRLGFSKSSSNIVYPISDFVSYHRLSKSHLAFALHLSSISIPSHFQEALENPKWKLAMVEEMKALQKNSTWEMVELPQGKKTVGCKWVFSVKYKSDGTIDRYKARLVAKGYTQTYGIDYQETFAPVAKMNTVRVILSLAVNLDWPLKQFDVKSAFLHGDLLEEVYMDPPPGFTPKEGKVCRLKKALYGLKQSPRAWFGRLSYSMKEFGYKQAMADHTLFYKRDGSNITLLIVYVDDMIVTGSSPKEIEKLQNYLAKDFEMKDLGTLKYFLGIEVSRSKQGLFLSQRKYTLDLLAETGNSACEPVNTPIEVNHGLSIYPDQIPTNKERYQRLVGKLIYLTHTRPDLSYTVSVVSQFMHNPSNQHMNARSKKQSVVSLSSAEAEYRALYHATTELTWLRILLSELGFGPKKPMLLFCDNTVAIEIANNPVQHDRTKHIVLDRNYIKDNLDSGQIKVPYIKSADQLADIMTHAVASGPFYASLSKLGMCDIYALT
ncbi:Retrovirus-related Pol polyprotein from transposon TNT 1-94 [Melia azedarach]|uniref:Retrovirus-related Pol polyprotein from transposon TNT 1-94 n=1 Tax=Melia azedarach TaxID=155640 RepID=A0ACC1X621_MELAZ|nr:Retrovirus-related Pol polyprotein from transposon TNT 1-94 [Melia azedarach]